MEYAAREFAGWLVTWGCVGAVSQGVQGWPPLSACLHLETLVPSQDIAAHVVPMVGPNSSSLPPSAWVWFPAICFPEAGPGFLTQAGPVVLYHRVPGILPSALLLVVFSVAG